MPKKPVIIKIDENKIKELKVGQQFPTTKALLVFLGLQDENEQISGGKRKKLLQVVEKYIKIEKLEPFQAIEIVEIY